MKETPIILNNFNRLTSTRNMYEFLKNRNFTHIVILDNASTYPPLLDWYATLEDGEVIRLPTNIGAHCLFDSGYLKNITDEYVVYSDSDLELNPLMPEDFLEMMKSMLIKYNEKKIGLALRIDDVPESCYKNCITGSIEHERQFWVEELEKDVYRAAVDTTFCLLHRPDYHDLTALRIAGNFTARHIPWYQDYSTLNEEEKYFVDNANHQSNFRNGYLAWSNSPKSKAVSESTMEIPHLMPHQFEPFNGDTFIEREFLRLKDRFNIETAVETGTCFGATTKFLGRHFKRVVSIESNEGYLQIARDFIGSVENIHTYLGASEKILGEVLAQEVPINEKIIFFLDAHWDAHCPLQDELRIIAEHKLRPVIVIHDFQVPDQPGLAFDSYGGQPFTFDWLKPLFDNIYGEDGYDHYYNSEINATEIKVGTIYVIPKRSYDKLVRKLL